MKTTTTLLALATTLMSLPSFAGITGGALYSKLLNASAKTAKERSKIFTKNYKFNQKSYASSCVEEALYAALPASLGFGMMASSLLSE